MAQATRKPIRKARNTNGMAEEQAYQSLDFTRKNWILFAAGLGLIAVGFVLLAMGDISLSPVLLVAGYLGLIPWALVTHAKPRGVDGASSGTGE